MVYMFMVFVKNLFTIEDLIHFFENSCFYILSNLSIVDESNYFNNYN